METSISSDSSSKKSQQEKKVTKEKSNNKKLDQESIKLLGQLKDKANKKPFGRKVRDGEIIALALKQITPEHICQLQNITYSHKDRLSMAHEEYQKKHGKISLDSFIGKLLTSGAGAST